MDIKAVFFWVPRTNLIFLFSAHGGETLINAYLVTNQGGVDFLKKEAVSFQPWEKGKRLERERAIKENLCAPFYASRAQ